MLPAASYSNAEPFFVIAQSVARNYKPTAIGFACACYADAHVGGAKSCLGATQRNDLLVCLASTVRMHHIINYFFSQLDLCNLFVTDFFASMHHVSYFHTYNLQNTEKARTNISHIVIFKLLGSFTEIYRH